MAEVVVDQVSREPQPVLYLQLLALLSSLFWSLHALKPTSNAEEEEGVILKAVNPLGYKAPCLLS